jgi:hypothetical protein
LSQCMVYVNFKWLRAGVVAHPSKWPFCGYNEIQNPRPRYSLIDYDSLIGLFGVGSRNEFKKRYRGWVAEALDEVFVPRLGHPFQHPIPKRTSHTEKAQLLEKRKRSYGTFIFTWARRFSFFHPFQGTRIRSSSFLHVPSRRALLGDRI